MVEMTKAMKQHIDATMEKALTTLEAKVNPAHTALVVVDVQNDFASKEGFMGRLGFDVSMCQAMVPRLVRFIDQARQAGVTIIYIQNIYSSEQNWYLSDVWLEQFKRNGKNLAGYVDIPVCEKNSWSGAFYEGIKPLPNEIIVNKHRFSAFMDTDLDVILRTRGIRTLIMTGISTNVCVETTSRDGYMKDYYIVFLKDCTATYLESWHNSTLSNIDRFFGQVVESGDVVKAWQKKI